jgi:photosystem II biogenesis protein Psp29
VNTVRTVSDTKRDFYKGFPKPVNSVYRRVVDELLVEIHLLVTSQTFAYDSIFALGVVTAFDRFTNGYKPEPDRDAIYAALAQSLHFNPEQLRQDASHLSELATRSPADVKSLLTTLEANVNLDPLMPQVRAIAGNPKFKYSRLFAVGVFTLLELADAQTLADNDKRQELIKQVGETLKVGSDRLFRDLDLYRSNLEKVAQARQMMADLVEAEQKKRQKQAEQNASKAATVPESQETPST